MKNYLILFAILIGGMLTSCSDDSGSPAPPTIYGTWQVVSGFIGADYVIIKETEGEEVYFQDGAFKSMLGMDMQVTSDTEMTILTGGGGGNATYTLTANELIIVGSGFDGTLRRSTWDRNTWATFLPTPSGGFALPAGVDGSDPGYDPATNTFLYADGYGNDRFYELNNSGTVTNDFPISQQALTAEPFSGGLLTSNNGGSNVLLLSRVDGTLLDSGPDQGPWLQGIAYDGTEEIYAVSNNDSKISSFDINTLAITEVGPITVGPTGLHYHNGQLYMSSWNTIYKMQISPFRVVDTYFFDVGIEGITHNGTDFYVTTRDNGGRYYLRPVTLN